ncbi:Bacteriophage Lambda NinG protein [Phocoenobacter uteri]|uniref:Bacteriophage Lambda NinG protein n=1 Tax=Phocoenobacter uteri TaxID=146806 RepID=A0A379C9Y8_9PAST|nr:recombination protein NinG [Phocoenobacter uteri]MDG6880963.1 hypothetical protein [Phocoenobacter uteri]SUB58979.1 Bacteriophage Lambda NinG protein [Phocoenobacter uteri]
MSIKRTPADDYFSKCVRARTNYTCERCGKQYDKSSAGLHCSHNFSRRHRTIRWCKENALALCFSCHSWYEGNPPDSGVWLEEKLGIGAVEILREKMNSKMKVPKTEEKDIAKHYREELKKIEKARANGVCGIVEFESWQ